MDFSRLSDSGLAEMYKSYDPDKDYNGAKGIAIAGEVESRAGGLEKISTWVNTVNLSESEKKLINYVNLADKYGINPNKCSSEGLGKRQELLKGLGINNLYLKKEPGMNNAPVCPIEHVPTNVLCSTFNSYYVRGLNLKEKLGLK